MLSETIHDNQRSEQPTRNRVHTKKNFLFATNSEPKS